jgi:transcriptional regulator with XRE-family HTH domain
MRFHELLKDLRGKASLTQAALAEKAGLPLSTIRGYEQGTRIPSWPAIVRLAGALKVPVDRFSGCDEVKGKGGRRRRRKK